MTESAPFSHLVEEARRERPGIALILGSGMGEIGRRLANPLSVAFPEIPGLKSGSVPGHKGCLTLGKWSGQPVLVFEGRLHFYEGHAWRDIIYPVRVAKHLGVWAVVFTNAAGGIHKALVPGSLMAITDHVEWTYSYCWRHPGPGGMGAKRSSPYSQRLIQVLLSSAQGQGLVMREGIYGAVTGPNYETPAEIQALRAWGADAVGMSTAREVQAAHDDGLECLAVSLITNRAAGLSPGPIHHEEVLATAAYRSEDLLNLLERFLVLTGKLAPR